MEIKLFLNDVGHRINPITMCLNTRVYLIRAYFSILREINLYDYQVLFIKQKNCGFFLISFIELK